MKLHHSMLDNGINLIKLTGTLDMQGVNEIELKFAGYCSGDHTKVFVDCSDVDFLASIGIRMLIVTARSVGNRGGLFAILSPTERVMEVFDLTGVKGMIPIYNNLEAALAGLSSSAGGARTA